MKKITLVIAAVLLVSIWPIAGAQMMMHNYIMNTDTTGNSGMGNGYGHMMGRGNMGYGMGYGMMNRGSMGYGMMNGMYLYHGNMMSSQMTVMPYFMIINSSRNAGSDVTNQ